MFDFAEKSSDMNDPTNLALYTQLLQFNKFTFLRERLFRDPDGSQQRTLHCLAHAMGLEYEYSRTTRTVTITKDSLSHQAVVTEDENLNYIDFDLLQPPEELPDDLFGLPIPMDSHETLEDYEIQRAKSTDEYSSSPGLCENSRSDELNLTSPGFDCTSGFWDDFDRNQSSRQSPPPAPLPIRPSATRKTLGRSGQQSTLVSEKEYFMSSAGSPEHSILASNIDEHHFPLDHALDNDMWGLDHALNNDMWGLPQSGNASVGTLGKPPNLLPVNAIYKCSFDGRVNGDHPTNYQPGFYDGLHQSDQGRIHGSVDNDNIPREHPLYQNAITGSDGLYHCPWEGKDPACNHKPEKLKCNYE